jgi:Flp pilus assembly pilin Flp
MLNRVRSSLARLHKDKPGQGLVEYLLILALLSCAAVAGTRNLATGLDSAVAKVSSIVGQYIGAALEAGNSGGHGNNGSNGNHGNGNNGNNGNHGNGNNGDNGNHGDGNNGNGGGNSGH